MGEDLEAGQAEVDPLDRERVLRVEIAGLLGVLLEHVHAAEGPRAF